MELSPVDFFLSILFNGVTNSAAQNAKEAQ
jgi:hypothetical protein